MRIAMANDHAGYALKQEIAQWLRSEGHDVEDFGTHDEQACDLPDFVYPAALALEVAKAWMATESLGTTEEKYARRVSKVAEIDARHVRPLGREG